MGNDQSPVLQLAYENFTKSNSPGVTALFLALFEEKEGTLEGLSGTRRINCRDPVELKEIWRKDEW